MNPVLLDVPEQFETQRLLLRLPMPGDGVIVNEAIRESFRGLNQWLHWADHVPEIEETEAKTRKQHANFLLRQGLKFQLIDKESTRFVGSCSLIRIDWNVRRFEISYWIRESASGQGLMAEAVKGITELAFKDLSANRVQIRCDATNTASRKVAERCGYHLEAICIKSSMNPSGLLIDECIYATVRLEDGTYGYPSR